MEIRYRMCQGSYAFFLGKSRIHVAEIFSKKRQQLEQLNARKPIQDVFHFSAKFCLAWLGKLAHSSLLCTSFFMVLVLLSYVGNYILLPIIINTNESEILRGHNANSNGRFHIVLFKSAHQQNSNKSSLELIIGTLFHFVISYAQEW